MATLNEKFLELDEKVKAGTANEAEVSQRDSLAKRLKVAPDATAKEALSPRKEAVLAEAKNPRGKTGVLSEATNPRGRNSLFNTITPDAVPERGAGALGFKSPGNLVDTTVATTKAPAPVSVKPTVAGAATGQVTASVPKYTAIKDAAKATLPEFSQKEIAAAAKEMTKEIEQRGANSGALLLKNAAKRNPVIAAAIAAGAVTIGGVGAWIASRKKPEAAAASAEATTTVAPQATPVEPAKAPASPYDPAAVMAKLSSMKNPGEAPIPGTSAADWDRKIEEIEKKYEAQKKTASVGELAATLGQALGLMIAGGLGQGGPQSSHGAGEAGLELLKRPAPDFSKQYERAAAEKDSRLSQVDKARALEAEQLAAEDRRKLSIWQTDKSAYAQSMEGRNRALVDLARIKADMAEKATAKETSQAGTIVDKQNQVDKDMAPLFQLVGQLQDPKADKKGITGKVKGMLFSMGIKEPERAGVLFKEYDPNEINAALEALTRISDRKKAVIAEARGGGVVAPQTQPAQLSQIDQQALTWARANPTDSRSKAILQRLGQ